MSEVLNARRVLVLIGQKASASASFSLDDLPSSSGRLDVLIQGLRSGLLVSHGVRRDTIVYLILEGGWGAPRTVRVEGSAVRYLRPDERSMATTLRKVLAAAAAGSQTFVPVRPGIAVADMGLDEVLEAITALPLYVLHEGGQDVRTDRNLSLPAAFVLGDHQGFGSGVLEKLEGRGARKLAVGPTSLHAGDAIVLLHAELDRSQGAPGSDTPAEPKSEASSRESDPCKL